jgi:hypothetical protein
MTVSLLGAVFVRFIIGRVPVGYRGRPRGGADPGGRPHAKTVLLICQHCLLKFVDL